MEITLWQRVRAWFSDSETIAFARLQTALGFIAAAITVLDPQLIAPILPSEYLPWFLLFNGLATEWLRRRRETDL